MFNCGPGDVVSPANGAVTFDRTTFGSVATFSCNTGFALIGDATRTCELTGWSGSNPTCGEYQYLSLLYTKHYTVLIPLNKEIEAAMGPGHFETSYFHSFRAWFTLSFVFPVIEVSVLLMHHIDTC